MRWEYRLLVASLALFGLAVLAIFGPRLLLGVAFWLGCRGHGGPCH